MGISNDELLQLIQDDLEKYEGVRKPVRATKFEQLFKRTAAPRDLHPNPEDEFCMPDIGPSFRIISEYSNKFRRSENLGADIVGEPLIVEKMSPDGYMLLNGHHRWAAAMRCDLKKVPIRVINLTHEADMSRMLENARSDKRVVFDLDEVVFCQSQSDLAEAALLPPFNRIFKERIRKGFPALAKALHEAGYDIWVYTRSLYSVDYLEMLFKQYHIEVDGIVSEARTAKKASQAAADGKAGESGNVAEKKVYVRTMHVDHDSVLFTNSQTKEFEHITFEAGDGQWSDEVLKILTGDGPVSASADRGHSL